jgi:hypothetical protein
MNLDPDPIDDTIAALTAIARSSRTVGARTQEGHAEPVDFGEIACHVLTAAAANVGGVETLLSGRPGSWEADYVRQVVLSTAGDSIEGLLHWRTEPLRLFLDTNAELADLGLEAPYEYAADEAASREEEAYEAMIQAFATPEERARIVEIRSQTEGLFGDGFAAAPERQRAAGVADEARAIVTAVAERAQAAGGPLVEAHAKTLTDCDVVDELWERDKSTYRAAYTDAVREALAARGVTVAVDVVEGTIDTSGEWAPLLDALQERARTAAALRVAPRAPMRSEQLRPCTRGITSWSDGTCSVSESLSDGLLCDWSGRSRLRASRSPLRVVDALDRRRVLSRLRREEPRRRGVAEPVFGAGREET